MTRSVPGSKTSLGRYIEDNSSPVSVEMEVVSLHAFCQL